MKIKKKEVKAQLHAAYDKCYYCGLAFNMNPIPEGQPLYKKFKSYSIMSIVNLPFNELPEIGQALAHQWCRNKTVLMSNDDKERFRDILTQQYSEQDGLPWLDGKLIKRYLQNRGNLMDLMKGIDELNE